MIRSIELYWLMTTIGICGASYALYGLTQAFIALTVIGLLSIVLESR
jgi:hypothetical protein